jgi:hypothetical protein
MISSYLQITASYLKSQNPSINTEERTVSRITQSLAGGSGYTSPESPQQQTLYVSNVSDVDLPNLSFPTTSLDGGRVTMADFTVYTADAPNTPVTTLGFPGQIFQSNNTEAYVAGARSFTPFSTARIGPTVDFITDNNPGLGRTSGKSKIYSFKILYEQYGFGGYYHPPTNPYKN